MAGSGRTERKKWGTGGVNKEGWLDLAAVAHTGSYLFSNLCTSFGTSATKSDDICLRRPICGLRAYWEVV